MLECEWGMVFDLEDIIWEIKKVKLKIVVMVYGEILIGWIYLLKVIGEVCCIEDVLFIVDVVVMIGGCEVKVDEWKIDVVIGGM